MSALSNSLKELFGFLDDGGQPPPLREVRLVEISHVVATDERGRLLMSEDALQKPSDYTSRFEDLIHSGLPWINMSCYGVYDGLLIVGIEIPDKAPEGNAPRLSPVNYSGPQASVIRRGWDASERIVIV